MIIIPEIETVVILVPRTGSGSFKRALLSRYRNAFMLYRHMEADGVPAGYDRWMRIGVCRHPVDRLWSMYKFLRAGGSSTTPTRRARLAPTVQQPFSDWLLNNREVFATGHDDKFRPGYHSLHMLPENQKSQFVYLRPDLGTTIFEYGDIGRMAAALGVKLPVTNTTDNEPTPGISYPAAAHVMQTFAWEIETFNYRVNINFNVQVA